MKRPTIAQMRLFRNQLALRMLIPTETPKLLPYKRPKKTKCGQPPEPKLTIEMIPQSCWYENLRKELGREGWDRVRKAEYRRAGHKCEICGSVGVDQGFKWPVECHEKWEKDEETLTYRLVGLVVLCPLCHKAKHIGRTLHMDSVKVHHQVIEHILKVNKWKEFDLEDYLYSVADDWRRTGGMPWAVDMSWIDSYQAADEPEVKRSRRVHRGRFASRKRRRRV